MIRHIVAMDHSRGIAKHGVQPWKIPSDEQYFTDMTKSDGGIVLMGRASYEAIGMPLKDRQNFVLSRNATYEAAGVTTVTDVNAFLDEYPDVWIIGGAQLCAATLRRTDELYLTHIDAEFACDTIYPEYADSFELKSRSEAQEENGFHFWYGTYVTKNV